MTENLRRLPSKNILGNTFLYPYNSLAVNLWFQMWRLFCRCLFLIHFSVGASGLLFFVTKFFSWESSLIFLVDFLKPKDRRLRPNYQNSLYKLQYNEARKSIYGRHTTRQRYIVLALFFISIQNRSFII